MKKYIFLFVIGLAFTSMVSAQTTITSDVSFQKYGRASDTLNLDDTVTNVYYINDFSVEAEIFYRFDSISGTPNVTVILEGSYDNAEWIAIDSDDLALFGVDGYITLVQELTGKLYPYLRTRQIGITSAQSTKQKQVLTIKTN